MLHYKYNSITINQHLILLTDLYLVIQVYNYNNRLKIKLENYEPKCR